MATEWLSSVYIVRNKIVLLFKEVN